jgi:hypothetical protein
VAQNLADLSDSDYLNSKNASPEVDGGLVVALTFYDDQNYDEPREPTPEEYERLGLNPDYLGCVEPHPEGADRGGYVPTLTNGCHYSDVNCEWFGG